MQLKIAVPRGAVGGTEFLFRRMGQTPPGGSVPGDVILVLRELEHSHLVRHGDDLAHVHCREAREGELLLRLTVPTLFGKELDLIADTLAVQLLDEGDVASIRLPGYGMPRAGGERRQRYVNSGGKRYAGEEAATTNSKASSTTSTGVGVGEGSGMASGFSSGPPESLGSEKESDWTVEDTSTAVGGKAALEEEEDDEKDGGDDSDSEEGEAAAEEEEDDLWGGPAANPNVDESAPVAMASPYGLEDDRNGSVGSVNRKLGDEMYGDLIVHFSARECMRNRNGIAGQQKAVASLHRDLSRELPTVLMIGPRPSCRRRHEARGRGVQGERR